jgi:hypothetical protein
MAATRAAASGLLRTEPGRRATSTNILHFPARVVVMPADAPHCSRGVERHEGTAENHVDADHGPPTASLRPPASESRPAHRGRTIATDLGVPRSITRQRARHTPAVCFIISVAAYLVTCEPQRLTAETAYTFEHPPQALRMNLLMKNVKTW